MQFPFQNTAFDQVTMSLSDAVCREDLRIDGHNSPDEKESLFLKGVQRSLVIFTIGHGERMILLSRGSRSLRESVKIPLNSIISGFAPIKEMISTPDRLNQIRFFFGGKVVCSLSPASQPEIRKMGSNPQFLGRYKNPVLGKIHLDCAQDLLKNRSGTDCCIQNLIVKKSLLKNFIKKSLSVVYYFFFPAAFLAGFFASGFFAAAFFAAAMCIPPPTGKGYKFL